MRRVALIGLRAPLAGSALLRRAQRCQSTTSSTAPLPALQSLLDAKRARLSELQVIQRSCQVEARRSPDRYLYAIFGFLCLQAAVLFDWVYVHFDWNLVEPITYLCGYAATWIAIAWYGIMQQEFGYDGLREMLEGRKLNTLYAAKGLDVKELTRLEAEVSRLGSMVRALEQK